MEMVLGLDEACLNSPAKKTGSPFYLSSELASLFSQSDFEAVECFSSQDAFHRSWFDEQRLSLLPELKFPKSSKMPLSLPLLLKLLLQLRQPILLHVLFSFSRFASHFSLLCLLILCFSHCFPYQTETLRSRSLLSTLRSQGLQIISILLSSGNSAFERLSPSSFSCPATEAAVQRLLDDMMQEFGSALWSVVYGWSMDRSSSPSFEEILESRNSESSFLVSQQQHLDTLLGIGHVFDGWIGSAKGLSTSSLASHFSRYLFMYF